MTHDVFPMILFAFVVSALSAGFHQWRRNRKSEKREVSTVKKFVLD